MHVVLSTGLGIENENLMQVKGSLSKIIELQGTRKVDMGVIEPEPARVKGRRWEVPMNILRRLVNRLQY